MRNIREYVRYSKLTDVISSVQLVASLIEPVQRHPILWKWIILGSHSGLQGAMVCNLSGTDGTGALKPKSRAKMLTFLQSGAEGDTIPDEWLADFNTLLQWIRDKDRISGGVTWRPDDKQLKHLAMLHKFRLNADCIRIQITGNQKRAIEHSFQTARVGLAHIRDKMR
jgi:hypothetical protein